MPMIRDETQGVLLGTGLRDPDWSSNWIRESFYEITLDLLLSEATGMLTGVRGRNYTKSTSPRSTTGDLKALGWRYVERYHVTWT